MESQCDVFHIGLGLEAQPGMRRIKVANVECERPRFRVGFQVCAGAHTHTSMTTTHQDSSHSHTSDSESIRVCDTVTTDVLLSLKEVSKRFTHYGDDGCQIRGEGKEDQATRDMCSPTLKRQPGVQTGGDTLRVCVDKCGTCMWGMRGSC